MLLGCFFSLGLLQAQECNTEEHSVNINDSWLSCEHADSPNPVRARSHWMMYDLGHIYSLGQIHFWNYNVSGATNQGMRNLTIDYSLDGQTWEHLADFQLEEASGSADYTGQAGPSFDDIDARYILITAVDTWGGACAGLSETKIDIQGTITAIDEELTAGHTLNVYPNPVANQLRLQTNFDYKKLSLYNLNSHEVIKLAKSDVIDISSLPNGVYFLKLVSTNKEVLTKKVVIQR